MTERNQDPSETSLQPIQLRKGTGNQGDIYEENMLVLYALKFCLDAEVKDVLMACNVDGFADLDDVILRVEYDQTIAPELYVIQLKHKEEDDYCITSNELTKSNKEDFSFEKYKKSYETIIYRLGDENNPLTKNISKENVRARLVTNAKLKKFDGVSFESTNVTRKSTLTTDLIDTKPGYFNTFHIANPTTPVQHEYSTFFDNYRFYDGQVNYKESKEEIMSLLKIRFNIENYEITEKLIKFILNEIKEKRNVLSKKIVKTKLLELLTGITDKKQLDRKYKTFKNITSINDHDQRITISKEIFISLQGREPLSLYELTYETFHKTVPDSFLLKNIKETVNVGKKDFEGPKNYIRRHFSVTPLLKREVLSETKKNIFLFTSLLPINIITKIKILNDLETTNLHSLQFTDSNLAIRVSENALTETINHIQMHEDLKSFAVHHVEEYNKRHLKWQRSWSDPENLRKYMEYDDTVNEQDALHYFKSDINIISAIPGMGKSTILHTLADYCKSNLLVLILDLNKHEKSLQDTNSELRQNPLEFILQKMKSGENGEFEEQLFIHLKEEKRLILFVDGFDEISPTHSDAVISIIRKVKDNQIPIWIFTRPVAKAFLQKHFGIIPIDMIPLQHYEINNYLVQTVGQAENNNWNDSLSCYIRNLCNAPLYLYMLSTLITEHRLNIRDLKTTDLYDIFIEMSYEKHMEKRNIATNSTIDVLESYKSTYFEVHKMAALVVIFGKDYLLEKNILKQNDLENIKHFKTGRKNYELIVSVDDETPEFSNRTFAEYFAALHIYENLRNKKENFREIYKLLFEDEYIEVRLMFDRITVKEFPFHLAFVEQDIGKLKTLSKDPDSSKMFETDEFGRTALHFAINYFSILFFRPENALLFFDSLMKHFKNREDILQQRDHILNLNFYEQWTKFDCEGLRPLHASREFTNIKHYYIFENDYLCHWTAKKKLRDSEYWNRFEGENLVHMAVRRNLTNIVECVPHVEEMRRDINKKTANGYTPILLATQYGLVNIIKLLKDNGGNINEIHKAGLSALHLAVYNLDEKCIDVLIREGADTHNRNDINSVALLHYVAEIGNMNIIELLIDAGAIDDIDRHGRNALYYACKYGHEEAVNCFIEHGIQINKKDHNGRTAMHCAAAYGYVNIMKLLKENGGRTDDIDSDELTVLHYAAKGGCIYCAKYLIKQNVNVIRDVYVNTKAKDGRTPLHVSAEKGNVDVLKYLIDNGGSIYETDLMGKTPLHYALESGHTKCVECLLNEIPELGNMAEYINQKTENGRTAVHLCTEKADQSLLKLLVDKGGNIYEIDSVGYTPLHYASQRGYRKYVEDLLNGIPEIGTLAEYVNQKAGKASDGRTHVEYLLNEIPEIGTLAEYVNQKARNGRTPVHVCAEENNEDILKLLIDKGGNLFETDSMGNTPLDYVLQWSNEDSVKNLLNKIPELRNFPAVFVNRKAKDGKTLLHLICHYGMKRVLIFLIDNGGNIYETDSKGKTPLHYASDSGYTNCIQYLLDKIPEVDKLTLYINQKAKDGRTAVHFSAQKRNEELLKLLVDKGGNIYEIDSLGNTPLHYAAESSSRTKCVQYLLNKIPELENLRIYVNRKAKDGRTSVHLSAASGNYQILKLLMDNEGNIYESDLMGKTPLHYASQYSHSHIIDYLLNNIPELENLVIYVNQKTKDGRTSVHFIAQGGHEDALKLLIYNGGSIYETDSMGKTPLHYASESGYTECVHYLLNEIPELDKLTLYINQKDQHGRTSFHFTAARGNFDILKLLIDKGGSIYETDSVGCTPLHYASQGGHIKCAEYLLKKIRGLEELKLYVNQKTKHGRTSMHFAASKGYFDIVKLLKEKGGRIDDVDQLGATALHLALSPQSLYEDSKRIEYEKCVDYLLRSSSDLGTLKSYANQKTIFARSPMHFAASSGLITAVELLIHHGARIDDTDLAGITPMHLAALSGDRNDMMHLEQAGADINKKAIDGSTPIHFCAQKGSTYAIQYLKGRGGNVNEINLFGETCLHHASSNGYTDCVQYLLKEGLDVNQKTCRAEMFLSDKLKSLLEEYGEENDNNELQEDECLTFIKVARLKEKCAVDKTPMHYAAAGGHVEIIKLLAEKGGRLDDVDSDGLTPLHHAASNGNTKCLKYLLDSGVDIRRTTKDGKTAFDCAIEYWCGKVINILNENSGNANNV